MFLSPAGLRLVIFEGKAMGSYTNHSEKSHLSYPGMEGARNDINHKTKIFRRVKKLNNYLSKTAGC